MIDDKRLPQKQAYLDYLEEVPVHKWASKAIKIDENTSKRWRDEDQDFADQCESRISSFVKSNVKRAKAEFKLERLLKDDFSPRQEITGADGQPFTIITGNGFIPTGVEIDATPAGTALLGQSPVQSLSVASKGTKD